MNLYDLTDSLKNVESMIIRAQEEGQAPDDLLTNALNSIQDEISTKVCNIGAWVKNLDAEAEAIKAEEARLYNRRKSKEMLQDRLKSWVLANIKAGNKFEDSRCIVSIRKSSRVEIIEQNAIADKFIKTKIIQEVDKEGIKAALKAGEKVVGAVIVENLNLTIK